MNECVMTDWAGNARNGTLDGMLLGFEPGILLNKIKYLMEGGWL